MDDNEGKSSRIQVIIAVIGVLGVLGAAFISNWDKIFHSEDISEQRAGIMTPPTISDGKRHDYQIIIDVPEGNEKVDQFTDVKYRIEGKLPSGYRPILLIRDPLGQYWSWGTAITNSHKRVQIGMPEDSGKEFEIGILVTNKDIPPENPTQMLPPDSYYKSVVVVRKR